MIPVHKQESARLGDKLGFFLFIKTTTTTTTTTTIPAGHPAIIQRIVSREKVEEAVTQSHRGHLGQLLDGYLNADELDNKDERRVRGDNTSSSSAAVAQVRRDDETTFSTLPHGQQAFVPPSFVIAMSRVAAYERIICTL